MRFLWSSDVSAKLGFSWQHTSIWMVYFFCWAPKYRSEIRMKDNGCILWQFRGAVTARSPHYTFGHLVKRDNKGRKIFILIWTSVFSPYSWASTLIGIHRTQSSLQSIMMPQCVFFCRVIMSQWSIWRTYHTQAHQLLCLQPTMQSPEKVTLGGNDLKSVASCSIYVHCHYMVMVTGVCTV